MVLELQGITRRFFQGGVKIPVLTHCDLRIAAGELVGLIGPSGSGKSTLLHIAGLLEPPDGGEILLNGEACSKQSDPWRTAARQREIGFVYQLHRLLDEFSACENVMIPQMIMGLSKSMARRRANALLRMVGLARRTDHRPGAMSGGEQQRVAIARALANAPSLLLADEPTGNLDPGTANDVFQILSCLVHETGMAALIVTHNRELAGAMDRVVALRDGKIAPV